MSDNVRVAVRVRPFNKRETDRNATLVIRMNKATQQTIITNPAPEPGHEPDHKFTFDYSYNSFVPRDDPQYASQDILWRDIGATILENAYNGYNCSLFAYGQTGAGKSYSMMGYGEDKGIIPMACERIFDNIKSNTNPDLTIRVEASMLEIYMEKIRDLFNPIEGTDLKVRNHPKNGFYVQGLTKNAVSSYEQISELMETGTMARTVASTNMNATSSRAHTVFQIILTQTKVDRSVGKATDKTSIINLIDLAGSERVSGTGATGDRLKEGAAINLSLSSLGNVISALAKNAKGAIIPYRDSVLTMLLQNSLGGNAKTVMIAALSPADINYDETLSTLRFADRAKQIKNKAIVNEDANETLIRSLREEIEALRRKLGSGDGGAGGGVERTGSGRGISMLGAKFIAAVTVEKQREQLLEELREKEELAAMESKPWEERLRETAALSRKANNRLGALGVSGANDDRATKLPHIVNLHEDPMLTEKIRFYIDPATEVRVGQNSAVESKEDVTTTIPSPTAGGHPILTCIPLEGVGIQAEHCVLSHASTGQLYIRKCTPDAVVHLNGRALDGITRVQLHHNDRLFIGSNHVFRVVIPSEAATMPSSTSPDVKIDFMFAFNEKNQAEIAAVKAMEAERRAALEEEKRQVEQQLREMETKAAVERAAAEEEAKKKGEEIARRQRELIAMKIRSVGKESLKSKEDELAREKAEFEAEQRRKAAELERRLAEQRLRAEQLRIREAREARLRCLLEDQLVDAILKVSEANGMSNEMVWGVRFFTKLINGRSEDEPLREPASSVSSFSVEGGGSGAGSTAKRTKSFRSRLVRNESKLTDDDSDDEDEDESVWDTVAVFIKMKHLESDEPSVYLPYPNFLDRLFQLRDMYQVFVQGGRLKSSLSSFVDDRDPCHIPHSPRLLGVSRIYLDPLQYGFHIDITTPIMDFKHGKEVGSLRAVVVAHVTDVPPAKVTDDDDLPEPLSSYMGRSMFITVNVMFASGLPARLCADAFAQFQFYKMQAVRTPSAQDKTVSPHWNWRHTFKVQVTDELCRFLSTEVLDIKVFATYSPTPAVDAVFSPTVGTGSPKRLFMSPMGGDGKLEYTDSKLDESMGSVGGEVGVMEALRSAVKRAVLFGKTKEEVMGVVSSLYQ